MSVSLSVPDRVAGELGDLLQQLFEQDHKWDCDEVSTGISHPRSCAACWAGEQTNRLRRIVADVRDDEPETGAS